MLHALITFAAEAAEHEESSKTAFYVAGGLAAAWGFLAGILGIMRNGAFPVEGPAKTMMGISLVLVLATMATAVATG